MTNTPQYFPDENPMQKQTLRERFDKEYDRILTLNKQDKTWESEPKPDIQPMTLEDYLIENSTIPLNEIMELRAADPENFTRWFEGTYPEGTKLCLAIVAFNGGCFSLDKLSPETKQQFFENQLFCRMIEVVDENGVSYWQNRAGYFFPHLPLEIQNDISLGGCTFKIKYPYPAGDPGNKEWFVKQQDQAIENIKKIFSQATHLN